MDETNTPTPEFETSNPTIEPESPQQTPPNPKQPFFTKLVARFSAIGIGKIASFLIGVILIISGSYKLFTACTGSNDKSDDIKASVKINEVVSDKDGVEFCVPSVDNVKTVGEGSIWEATTDNNYIVLSIEITNKSNEPYDVNALRFVLICDGKEYQYGSDTLYTFDNYMTMDTINPDISKKYKLVYEVPTTTDESEYVLKIKPVGFSDKDSVYITLK